MTKQEILQLFQEYAVKDPENDSYEIVMIRDNDFEQLADILVSKFTRKSFLNVLEENLSAIQRGRRLVERHLEEDANNAIEETYNDLIAIYKAKYEVESNGTEETALCPTCRNVHPETCSDTFHFYEPIPSPDKSLKECKDEVAKKHGFVMWDYVEEKVNKGIITIQQYGKYCAEYGNLCASSKQGSEWVRVEDRLPEGVTSFKTMSDYVMVYCSINGGNYHGMGIFCHDRKKWYAKSFIGIDCSVYVTHWMPLPSPPLKG